MVNNTTISTTDNETLMFGILGSLGSLGVLLNGLLLFVLWRNKTSEFRNGTSFIIGNLALADSFTGIAVLIYVSRIKSLEPFQLSMVWTTILASLLSLMLLSIERTIAFAYPFKSATIVTIRRTLVVLVCIWFIAVSCGVTVHFYKVPTQLALTVIYEASVVIFTISHGVIFVKMRRRNRHMHFLSRNISRDTRKAMHQSANNHVTTVVLILVFILVVTVLPYMIALQLILWDKLKVEPILDASVVAGVEKSAYYLYPIELLNFIVNPVIYAWRLKRYRRAFVEALAPFICFKVSVTSRTRNGSVYNSRDSFVRYGKAGDSVMLARASTRPARR